MDFIVGLAGSAERVLINTAPLVELFDVMVGTVSASPRELLSSLVLELFPMIELIQSVVDLLAAGFGVVKAAFFFLLPYLGLICWVGYWLLAVNWTKLFELLFKKGGIVPLGLLVTFWIFIWCTVSPPADGHHDWFGFKVSNAVGKTVYVTSLMSIAFLCGSVQLSGAVNRFINFTEELEADALAAAGGHGHGQHGGHGHDDHGHGDHGHGEQPADHGHADHGHAVAHGH